MPWAFQGVLRISALFTLVAALMNIATGRIVGIPGWLTAVASLAFAILAVLPIICETILYKEFIDPLFKKKQSVNVIGKLRQPGTESVKRVLIISGHHNSALEFTWLRLLHSAVRWGDPGGRPDGARQNGWIMFLGYTFLILTVTMFIGPVFMLGLFLLIDCFSR